MPSAPSARTTACWTASCCPGWANRRLLFLPPYSPKLNPAEHLWDALREQCFANHFFTDLDAVERALTAGLQTLEADPERTRSMTGFDWITSISLNAT